jgi:hypothetical protein
MGDSSQIRHIGGRKFFGTNIFQETGLDALTLPMSQGLGSPIWKLMKVSLPLIQGKCTWIPGNGNLIQVWTNSIMGNPLLCKISLWVL